MRGGRTIGELRRPIFTVESNELTLLGSVDDTRGRLLEL